MNLSIRMVSASLLGALILTFAPVPSASPLRADAAVSGWQKGVSILPRWNTDFTSDSFKESVRNAQAMGASHIYLIIPYMQDNYQSSNIYETGNTPSAATIGSAIDYIHGLGMKAVLKPHVELGNAGWRAMIDSTDRNTWYANYTAILNKLADVGQSHHADMMVIGTELIGMASPYMNPDNTQRWQTIIASVRTHYSGPLTYSANWGRGINWTNEFEQIGFWPQLDYIGISAYFDMNQDPNNNSVDSFKGSWQTIDQNQIQPLQTKYGKPVLFTEIGYKSADGSHTQPWNYDPYGGYNPQEQVNLYEALFQYWSNRSYFSGLGIWGWSSDPNYGGQGNTDYTPRNKPAETTIKTWWSGGTTQPPPNNPPPTTPPSGTWSSSAQAPSAVTVGSSATFPVTVSITGQAQNVIVDTEIYDSTNAKVFQKFFEGQNISQTAPGNYSVAWTPGSAGTYKLKVGVFSSTWNPNYHWNDNALTFSATAPGQNPPPNNPPPNNPPPPATTTQPTSYTTDIWWPTDGATVSGTQPFKAMLENKNVNEYKMYWQVDGRQLVEMSNSNTDYPHKEFIVDLSAWNWNPANRYFVNFVSKDLNGTMISQKAVTITVPR